MIYEVTYWSTFWERLETVICETQRELINLLASLEEVEDELWTVTGA